jgi:Zn-dependent protease
MLFFEPSPTRYDLRFPLGPIPVRIHPMFWLVTAILGLSRDLLSVLVWIVVVLISLLVHEMGHALVMRRYGQDASIVLYGGGGLAIPENLSFGGYSYRVGLSTAQSVLISLAGPLAGFALAGLVWGIGTASGALAEGGLLGGFLRQILWVNIAWGIFNLLPIYPLDGGKISRELFERFDPRDGLRKSLWLSIGAAAVAGIAGLLVFNSPYLVVMFGLFAYQNYMSLRGGMF